MSQVEPKIRPKLLLASLEADPAISELLGRRHSTEDGDETAQRNFTAFSSPAWGERGRMSF